MSDPHFIIFANEKGGTGKSTTAVHTAIALAASGHRVAALDLDARQRTMARYLENRDATMRRLDKELPHARFEVLDDHTDKGLSAAIARLSEDTDVIVVDTPGRDDPVSRAAILRAAPSAPRTPAEASTGSFSATACSTSTATTSAGSAPRSTNWLAVSASGSSPGSASG